MLALLPLLACALPARSQTAALWHVEGITPSNSLVTVDQQGVRRQLVLAYLSIPAGRQPYADRAAKVLRAQLVGQQIDVRPVGRQGQDYVSALVYVGSNNFNDISFGSNHTGIGDTDYQLSPLNPYGEIVRGRTAFMSCRFSF